MLRITVGGLALVGVIVGGFALVKVGPIIGPINFNRESPLLSEDDEQRARALRIAAERKAEKAAEKRAEAEEKAAEAARDRETRDRYGRKTDFGEIYVVFCPFDLKKAPPEQSEGEKCSTKMDQERCPGKPAWMGISPPDRFSVRLRKDGMLYFC